MSKKIINWFTVIVWLAVIYYFSSQPNLKSELEPMWDLIFRKIAHIAEYFILAFLFLRALEQYRLNFRNLLLVTCFLSLVSAGFDEWHQSFIAGRVASPLDVGIDSLGVLGFMGLKIAEKGKK
ncbi:MAG: VanZ family protein [Patescibacteria group bacterium]|jgi:VanZ family protein